MAANRLLPGALSSIFGDAHPAPRGGAFTFRGLRPLARSSSAIRGLWLLAQRTIMHSFRSWGIRGPSGNAACRKDAEVVEMR